MPYSLCLQETLFMSQNDLRAIQVLGCDFFPHSSANLDLKELPRVNEKEF